MKMKAIKMVIRPGDNVELARVVAILCIGVCDAIARRAMTVDDAERYLFNPHTLIELQKCGVSSSVTDLVHLGTELENVERLLPQEFLRSVEDIKQRASDMLSSLPETTASWVSWLESVTEA